MESISLDASLNLPTIDPAPARLPTNPGDAQRRFDDELRRASFPPLAGRDRAPQPAERNDAASRNAAARHDEPTASATEPTDDDSSCDDSLVNKNHDDSAAAVKAGQDNAKSETADEHGKPDESAVTDADAAAAAASAQCAAEKVATKPTTPVGALAQPSRIEALPEPGQQTGDTPAESTASTQSAGANVVAGTPIATSDTPDVFVQKATCAIALSKPGELHATATTQAKVGAANSKLASTELAHTDSTDSQSAAATTTNSTDTVAPIVDQDDRSDKKRYSAKPHATAAGAAKLDAAVANEAKSQLQTDTVAAVNDLAAQAAADAAAQIAVSTVDARSDENQTSNATAVATHQAAEAAGKSAAAAPATAPSATTATQKLLDGTSRTQARSGDNSGEVDRDRFVQRVSKAFQTASERGGPLRLRLSPPELGSVRMEVSIRHGVMTARLEAETTTAQSMLLDNLPALRERLAQHNIKVERFDVDLLGQSSDGAQQNPMDTSDRQAARLAPLVQQRRNAAAAVEDKSTAAPTRRTVASGQLNVII